MIINFSRRGKHREFKELKKTGKRWIKSEVGNVTVVIEHILHSKKNKKQQQQQQQQETIVNTGKSQDTEGLLVIYRVLMSTNISALS